MSDKDEEPNYSKTDTHGRDVCPDKSMKHEPHGRGRQSDVCPAWQAPSLGAPAEADAPTAFLQSIVG
jgi:hypothetical protein